MIMTVDLGLFVSFVDKCSLLFVIVVFGVDWVKVVSFPVSLSCLSLKDLLVSLDFCVVVLQVLVRNNVVVFEVFVEVLFYVDLYLNKWELEDI